MSNLHPVFEGIIKKHFPKKIEDAEIVEETWRDKEIKQQLYTMDRNNPVFWEWLEWCRVIKKYQAKKIIAIGRNFTEYVELYHDFLKDWYKTDIRERNF